MRWCLGIAGTRDYQLEIGLLEYVWKDACYTVTPARWLFQLAGRKHLYVLIYEVRCAVVSWLPWGDYGVRKLRCVRMRWMRIREYEGCILRTSISWIWFFVIVKMAKGYLLTLFALPTFHRFGRSRVKRGVSSIAQLPHHSLCLFPSI